MNTKIKLTLKYNLKINKVKTFILVVLILLVGFSTKAQIEKGSVNGIVLGEKYTGSKMIATNLGFVQGLMVVQTLEDSTVYGVVFQSSPAAVSVGAISLIKSDFEDYYNTRFRVDEGTFDQRYYFEIGDYKVVVKVFDTQQPDRRLKVWVSDVKLETLYNKQELSK